MKKKLLLALASVLFLVGCGEDGIQGGGFDFNDIKITNSSMSVDVNTTSQLSVINNKLNSLVKWSSSNTDVAKVDKNGNVTGLSIGSSVITAEYKGMSSTCSVEVYNSFNSPFIVLSNTELTLNIGDEYVVNPTLMYKGQEVEFESFRYESSDITLLRTQNNKITALNNGEASIYVSATYLGNFVNSEIKVTVNQYDVSLFADLTPTEGGYEVELNVSSEVTISPKVYVNLNEVAANLTWSTSDNEIATVNQQGKITGVSVGKATVVADYRNIAQLTIFVTVK